MHILVIDYISPIEHINFDLIHIQSLLDLGHRLHLVGRKGQFLDFNSYKEVQITDIPDRFYIKRPVHSLSARVQGLLSLWWIKSHIGFGNYDLIIFLSYDILSFFTFRTSVPVYLINHNNVDQLDNRIKLYLTKTLKPNYSHIALNEYMENKMKELLPKKNILFVPHGFLKPADRMSRPSFLKDDGGFVFCPVNRNYDAKLVSELINSPVVNNYIRDNRMTIFFKSQLIKEEKENILPIGMLTDEEYDYMLTNAMAVLLPYGEDFKYRCSGILFECVARNTPILATEREALKVYMNKIGIHFFSDANSFIDVLAAVHSSDKKCYDTEAFRPKKYWKQILEIALCH